MTYPRIPVELYRPILCFLSPDELCNSALVSRAFGDETEHVLYKDIDLHQFEQERAYRWCLAIKASPRRAQMVKSLCLNTTFEHIAVSGATSTSLIKYSGFISCLQGALQAVVNLKHLRFMAGIFHANFLPDWVFDGSTFQLESLSEPSGRLQRTVLLRFLMNQPSIVDWCPSISGRRNDDQYQWDDIHNLMPRLSIMQLRIYPIREQPLLKLIASRPIQRLRISTTVDVVDGNNVADIMALCQPCGATLTHLDLDVRLPDLVDESRLWSIEKTIAMILQTFPMLRYLRYRLDQNIVPSKVICMFL